AGEFEMGEKNGADNERPTRIVRVREFYMGPHPVTNEQYERFRRATGARRPWYARDPKFQGPSQPVVGVSWDDAMSYCKWAGLRPPSEAEWEYACRGGTTTKYWSGDDPSTLDGIAWYVNNACGDLHAVGERPANQFGLCEMHGSIWEWCQDTW